MAIVLASMGNSVYAQVNGLWSIYYPFCSCAYYYPKAIYSYLVKEDGIEGWRCLSHSNFIHLQTIFFSGIIEA